eukprot:CAMPEP_0170543782 /NCGR_PEP_ID=MMETSP0211-20121228/2780_1 /TAXON_ID=311385 /ORGANISM="Pseudokeronopsis sp., Strain OXSARD2" /LENGTH=52 /DNA_ID=CAMNT_0010847247 /DNA_START=86 /DNA_END=244 /DNA_ORIENTATION=-
MAAACPGKGIEASGVQVRGVVGWLVDPLVREGDELQELAVRHGSALPHLLEV